MLRVISEEITAYRRQIDERKMIYHYGNEKSLLVMKQPHIPELVLEG